MATNIATMPKNGQSGNLGNHAENKDDLANPDADEAKDAKLKNPGNHGPAEDAPTTDGPSALFDDDPDAGPYSGGF